MSALSDFFFKAPPAAVRLQLLEISHPRFSQTFKVVRNFVSAIYVQHEDTQIVQYQHFPLRISEVGSDNSLDQEIQVTLGDLGQVLPVELDNVNIANAMQTKPVLKYREYLSNSYVMAVTSGLNQPLYINPVRGPFTLEVNSIAFNKQGAVFTAKPPAFNRVRTGEYYTVERFPMLRGFL